MIVSAHQPNYVPYLGLFYKIYKSDVFVYFDDVQFSKSNGIAHNGIAHNRNVVKTSQGTQYLKVPVNYKFGDSINNVRVNYSVNWQERHLQCLSFNYKKAQYFNEVFSFFEELIYRKYESLAEMNIEIITMICGKWGINRPYYKTSEFQINKTKVQRIIRVMEILQGQKFYSGHGAKVYMDEKMFTDRNMELVYSDYEVRPYKQLWNSFIPNLSVLDYLFNEGFKNPF